MMIQQELTDQLAPSAYSSPSNKISTVEMDDQLVKEIKSIPNKMAFKIGEVSEMTQLKPYVLRYWESEFKALKPKKSHKNQRVYSKKDVELIFLIRKLLHGDRFSIQGARSALRQLKKEASKVHKIEAASLKIESLRDLAQDLVIDIQTAKKKYVI